MFERFTDRARQVVVLAQDEARTLGHSYIGTEHLLLGLLREEEGLAARTLAALAVTSEEVRERITQLIGLGDDERVTGQIPFTPRAKHVLEIALREALSFGHNYIGTEHILLGVVRESEGVAARILAELGADADTIRDEVVSSMSGTEPGRGLGPGVRSPRASRAVREAASTPPRFTHPARGVLILAQDEARAVDHAAVSNEHLLLGLLCQQDGLAARLLDVLGVTPENVRAHGSPSAAERDEAAPEHIPFSPELKSVLERARNEALSLGHAYVGTEHLLVALLREDDGIAARVRGPGTA
jgi:ATP-dependent Clp protease ATP-binding subunit ClpA